MELKKWRTQIILAVVLVIFGYFVYWYEFSHRPKKEEAADLSKKIIPIKEKVIQSIRLVDGDQTIEFQCLDVEKNLCKPGDHSDWAISAPEEYSADRGNVNSLVSSLNNVSASQTIDLSDESAEKKAGLLQEYGLDETSRTSQGFRRVEVITKEGEKLIAFLGVLHPIGDQLFVTTAKNDEINDDRVLLVPKYFQSNFEHELSYWRNKKLFPKPKVEVTAFSYSAGKTAFTARQVKGQWQLTKGKSKETYRGDVEAIERFLSTLTHLNAKEFGSDDKGNSKAKRLLRWAKKKVSVKLTEGEQSTQVTLYERPLRGKPSEFYATVSSQKPLFEIEASSQERVTKDFESFREKRLISSLEKIQTSRIELSGKPIGDQAVTIQKADESWTAPQESQEINKQFVDALLDKLAGKRIKNFLNRAPRADQDQSIKLSLEGDSDKKKAQFLFWKDNKDQLYARDLSRNAREIYLLDSQLTKALPWSRSQLFKSSAPEVEAPQKKNESDSSSE